MVLDFPKTERRKLANGLEVVFLENHQAPVVTTALLYRCGTRDETHAEQGAAHFLEHMMFKGSERFGPGEVDRVTQELGGANNAFTSHDVTAYYFQFSSEHWHKGLEIESDRLRGLTLDPAEVDSERSVILEEIAMYDNDPWSALDLSVSAQLFREHAYGRPVLGTRESLRGLGAAELKHFHQAHYRPNNATLVVAGDFGGLEQAFSAVEKSFGSVPSGLRADQIELENGPSLMADGLSRLVRHEGSVARLQLSMPGPPADHVDFAALRVLLGLLTWGRSSRLQSTLVEREQSCVWVMSELREHQGPGMSTLALEVVPGHDPGAVEDRLFGELARLRHSAVEAEELERARNLVSSDWVFGHERIHQQALSVGVSYSLFGPGHAERTLKRALSVSAGELVEAARRYLDPELGAVVGWMLPAPDKGAADCTSGEGGR
jgi:zinc protease